MAKVFVSFRNGDEPFAAALLYRALAQRFGPEAVFRSSDCIPPGADWARTIWDNHRDSAVVIVVVGPRWLSATDDRGRRRLWQRDDWVRAEVDGALRAGKHIIPVLLAGTTRFTRKELPRSLAGLAARQTIPMDHRNVDGAVDRIAAEISRQVESRDGGTDAARWLGIWNIPSRLPGFVERDELMRALREDLAAAQGHRPVVVHGGVGVGKTQLAIEYAYRFAGDHQLAWWVSGASPELLWTELAGLGRAAGFAIESGVAAAMPALARELHRRGRWLLVFDGFEEPGLLAEPLAAIGSGADILITSRRPDWGMLAGTGRPVGHFDRHQSVRLLGSHLAGAGVSELDRLAAAVADLPLAVAQTAAFLPGSTLTTGEYVALLGTRSRELLARGETYRYPRSLAAAWSVGVDRLRATAPDAAELLELLSVLAPAPMPLDVLGVPADPIRRADAAAALAGSGLVPVVAGRPHPHGLLQAFVREGMTPARVTDRREAARLALARASRPDPRTPQAWDAYPSLLPHVTALDLAASPDARCHELLLDTSHHLIVRGDPAAARALVGAAATRWCETHGPDAPTTLAALSRLAQAHFRLRDYRRALAIDEEVLAGRRRRSGEDDPETLEAAHNLAMARFAVDGADTSVVPALAELVARRTRLLGADHADTLRSAHNLALVRRAGGDLVAAWELDRDTHQRLSDVLGADHPDALRSAHALALDLRALGRTEPARELESDTYQRRRRVLGPDHPDTLRSAYALAVCWWAAGETGPARELAEEAYQRRGRVLGDDHPDTLRSAFLLGAARRAGGDPAGDRVVQEATVALRRRVS